MSQEPIAERRANPRLPVNLSARIPANDMTSPIECAVVSLSRHGARLEPLPPRALPPAFDVSIDVRAKTYRARVVWREGGLAGVAFDSDDAEKWGPENENDDAMARIRRSLRFGVRESSNE